MNIETKDIILAVLGLLGWTWGIVQFILTRRNQKRDKALEKRFEVYSAFMNKADEISQNMRTDPKMIYGITTEFFSKIISGDEEETNKALIDFNAELIEYTRKSVQPMMILNQELNKLKFVCSDKLLPKIEQYKQLANDYSDEFQIVFVKFHHVVNEFIPLLLLMELSGMSKSRGIWF
jgi:DnaJ-domain-containing protein 1